MGIPAGWYPQADGQQWTEHFAPGVPAKTPQDDIPGGKPADTIAATSGRRVGMAEWFGWGGLEFVVLSGAVGSGFSGAMAAYGLFAFVVAVIALVRGQVGWARLRSRAAGGAALAVALVLITIFGIAAPEGTPTSDTVVAPVPSTTKPAATSPESSATSTATATPTKPNPSRKRNPAPRWPPSQG